MRFFHLYAKAVDGVIICCTMYDIVCITNSLSDCSLNNKSKKKGHKVMLSNRTKTPRAGITDPVKTASPSHHLSRDIHNALSSKSVKRDCGSTVELSAELSTFCRHTFCRQDYTLLLQPRNTLPGLNIPYSKHGNSRRRNHPLSTTRKFMKQLSKK